MSEKLPCPKCGENNYTTDRECLSCGAALQAVAKPAAQRPGEAPVAARPVATLDPPAAMPPWLWVLAVLPLGIMILTRGGAIWGAMGGGLMGLNMWVGKKPELHIGVRTGIILAVTAVAYAIVIPLVVAARH
ncbi:MAG: hypothetical protein ACYC63_02655 [Armatimonadota bacterium]